RDGGWHGDGVSWRDSFLVSKDHRKALSGELGAAGSGRGVRRIQFDVLPAIPPRLPGYAEALRNLRGGISGIECLFDRRRVDPRRRIRHAHDLSCLGMDERAEIAPESMECQGTRVGAITYSAANIQFRRAARGHRAAV